MQHEVRQKSELQAALIEIHKLRKEFNDHLKAQQPWGAGSAVVGVAQLDKNEGAVGGDFLARNKFSTALEESEQATSKMKGKEEVGENEMMLLFGCGEFQ